MNYICETINIIMVYANLLLKIPMNNCILKLRQNIDIVNI